MPTQRDTFQARADPTRRRIVEALRHGEQQVVDLVTSSGIHRSGVSRHLRILHGTGFVSVRPEGQRRLYSLKPEPFRELDRWLAQYRDRSVLSSPNGTDRKCSEQTVREIDLEVRRIIEEAQARSRRVLEERRSTLDRIATRLVEQETIDAAELERLLIQ